VPRASQVCQTTETIGRRQASENPSCLPGETLATEALLTEPWPVPWQKRSWVHARAFSLRDVQRGG
jgi:hypothetical protein